MIIKSTYLSEDQDYVTELSGLNIDELEQLVGRFAKHSHRAGKMRGELIEYATGEWAIRHHFTKKIIYSFIQEQEL